MSNLVKLARWQHGHALEHCQLIAAQVRSYELLGNLPARNELVASNFKYKEFRKLAFANTMVETWYDLRSKSWITQTYPESNPADLNGEPLSAAISHFWAIGDAFLGPAPKRREGSQPFYGLRHSKAPTLSAGGMLPEAVHQFLRKIPDRSGYRVFRMGKREPELTPANDWLIDNRSRFA